MDQTAMNQASADIHPSARIHPSAEVEPGVIIGADTQIWRRTHIRSGARIGAGVMIGSNVFVDVNVPIGDRVKIENNVSVHAGVLLEDEVFVGPSAAFTNDLAPRAISPDWVLTPTVVRFGASIGANATIVCGHEIGEHCLVAAGSVVTRPVAPHQLVMGNPARPSGWVCRCGIVVSRETTRPATLECTACSHSEVTSG
jgi:acetyltransferase-like isoleucine patch superfamily enzyme